MEAAEYGLRRMNELVTVQEPRLYEMGMWLDRDDPARYVAAFNEQSEQARRLARFGYAALQASSKLMQRVYEGRGSAPRLPAISLVNTPLYEQCPLRSPPACPSSTSRYRTLDGSCNNPAHPWRGAAMTPLRRFLPPHYRDGLERIRDSASGGALPSARAVSSAIHGDRDVQLASVSHMVMQWGQFLDHDLTATAQSRGFNGSVPKCCGDGGRSFQPPELTHPDCLAIGVPPGDKFYSHYGVQCLEFVRSSPALRHGCTLGPRDQINQVTSYIDGSVVYGSGSQQADQLRLHRDGLLRYSRVQYRLPLLPPKPRGAELCRGASGRARCFWAGDGRVNEQPGLAAAHTLWLRAHNRLATELSHLNPRWGDERLYQEARRLVAAMLQHVTYAEFLPIVLGEDVMKTFGLQLLRRGYYDRYDITADATAANEFAAAAFRFGHSLVQRSLVRGDRNHQQLRSNVSLHEELTNPVNLYNIGSVDRLLLGLCMQPSQKRDEFITEQLTNHLFQTPSFHYGMDLAAINIQRGRDHGLAPYNAWREACGLQQFSDWHDLLRVMSADTLRKLQGVYRDVNDIDLFPGGMAERPVSGGLVGPTFACIIAQQFRNLRKGDRFWYENEGFVSSFTPAQLQQLRKVTLARLLCDNLDTIDTIQPFVFLMSDHDRNPYVSCDDRLIPQFSLKPWIEQPKDSHNYYPSSNTPDAGYPSARPENEAEDLPLYPPETIDGQQRPQSEQVLPSFLIDEDLIDEENSASTSESIAPAYLVDNDKLQHSESPDSHYTTESLQPSYLIGDKFQQSKPPEHPYTTEHTKPLYLIDDKFQQSKPPNHHYTTFPTKPSYSIEDKFQHSKPPNYHYTTERTKPSYLTDNKFQQSKPPNYYHTTENTKPSYLIHDKFQQSKPPNHHYSIHNTKPSYLIDDKFQYSHKPNHPHTTESPVTPLPSIIIIEEFLSPPKPIDSKPAIEVITTHPQISLSESQSTGPGEHHYHYGDNDHHTSDTDQPIYIIIPGKEPVHQTSSYHEIHGYNRPDKYQSTRPSPIKDTNVLRPSHFYEEYTLNESGEHQTTSQKPNYYGRPHKYPPTSIQNSGYKSNSKPYSFIERYNEPSYYYHGAEKGQTSNYLKHVGLWLPDEDYSQEEMDTETSMAFEKDADIKVPEETDGSGDGMVTDSRYNEWSFDATDIDDDSKLPEMPSIASDPQALSELPRPMLLFDEVEFGSGDDSRSLA